MIGILDRKTLKTSKPSYISRCTMSEESSDAFYGHIVMS